MAEEFIFISEEKFGRGFTEFEQDLDSVQDQEQKTSLFVFSCYWYSRKIQPLVAWGALEYPVWPNFILLVLCYFLLFTVVKLVV
jgi:hypothetical protein